MLEQLRQGLDRTPHRAGIGAELAVHQQVPTTGWTLGVVFLKDQTGRTYALPPAAHPPRVGPKGVIVAWVVPHYDRPLPDVRESLARFDPVVPTSFIELGGCLVATALGRSEGRSWE